MDLIILGNEFDLACTIPTSYKEFFLNRILTNKKFYTKLNELLYTKQAKYIFNDGYTATSYEEYENYKRDDLADFTIEDLLYDDMNF